MSTGKLALIIVTCFVGFGMICTVVLVAIVASSVDIQEISDQQHELELEKIRQGY